MFIGVPKIFIRVPVVKGQSAGQVRRIITQKGYELKNFDIVELDLDSDFLSADPVLLMKQLERARTMYGELYAMASFSDGAIEEAEDVFDSEMNKIKQGFNKLQ